MVHVESLRKGIYSLRSSLPGIFNHFCGSRADIVVRVVRGNYGQQLSDLEILDIVEFMLFSGVRRPWGSIFVECKFFYPVAFFLGQWGGYPQNQTQIRG